MFTPFLAKWFHFWLIFFQMGWTKTTRICLSTFTPLKFNMEPDNQPLEVWRSRTWKPSFSGFLRKLFWGCTYPFFFLWRWWNISHWDVNSESSLLKQPVYIMKCWNFDEIVCVFVCFVFSFEKFEAILLPFVHKKKGRAQKLQIHELLQALSSRNQPEMLHTVLEELRQETGLPTGCLVGFHLG